jgi:hypothetical protein
MKKENKTKTKSERLFNSSIFIVFGIVIGYYFLNSEKIISISDTITLNDTISNYWFDECTKTGKGYSEQCFYFNLKKYKCSFQETSLDREEAKNTLNSSNRVTITIEKSDINKLMTNKTVQTLSLHLNGEDFKLANEGIESRNWVIAYLLPVLSILCLFFGFKDLYKLLNKTKEPNRGMQK